MKNTKHSKTIIAGAIPGVALTVLSSSPAFAVNRTGCNQRGVLKLTSPATTCWANKGRIDVALFGVSVAHTGNRDVDLTFRNAETRFYKKNGTYPFLPGSTVVRINIR